MGLYDTEQGAEYDTDASRMDADLKPWLREEWGLDVFLTEFPYHQYQGTDIPLSDTARGHLDHRDHGDPSRLPDSIIQDGPFRTDLVGVRVDRRALRTRIRRVGTTEPLNQPREGKRRYRRTYLTFSGDGPMTREYWEQEHGGLDELRTYGEDSARRAFGWLKERQFLAPVHGPTQANREWDAVDIPLHIHAGVHAVELKLERCEWIDAVEQAARADVFADYRWIAVPGEPVLDAPPHDVLAACEDTGVGLIMVHPQTGVNVEVWAEQCTPTVDRDLLNRYMVERWDVNERVLKQLNAAHDPDRTGWDDDWTVLGMFGVSTDILGEIDADNLETEQFPPTANGHVAEFGEDRTAGETTPGHTPLTAFSGEGDE